MEDKQGADLRKVCFYFKFRYLVFDSTQANNTPNLLSFQRTHRNLRVLQDNENFSIVGSTSAEEGIEPLKGDTLQLSRIGRMVNPPEDVSFGEIVQEALEQTA